MAKNEDNSLQFNVLIEERIDEFYQAPEAEGAAFPVLASIITAMRENGQMLVPVETPENILNAFDPEKVKEGDVITSDEELHWKMIQLTNDQGQIAMPIYTSSEKMNEAGAGCVSTFNVDVGNYFKQVLEAGYIEGILINPGEHSFFLDKDIIKVLVDEHRKLNQEESSKNTENH